MDAEEAHRAFVVADPPAPQLEAIGRALELGPVRDVRRLEGGLASAVHRLDFDRTTVVVRRFDADNGWHDPEHVRHEAAVLHALEVSRIPVPRVLMVDPDGSHTGCPMLVLTLLPGASMAPPATDDRTLGRLVDAMLAVHSTPPVPEPARWYGAWQGDDLPQRAARHLIGEAVWEAVLAARPELLAEPTVLIHNDLHPGNTLWHAGRLTGIVDWAAAGIGHGGYDAAYCAGDLALSLGSDAADRFLSAWARATGRVLHPGWRAVAALTLIGDLPMLQPAYAELGMSVTMAELHARYAHLVAGVRSDLGLSAG